MACACCSSCASGARSAPRSRYERRRRPSRRAIGDATLDFTSNLPPEAQQAIAAYQTAQQQTKRLSDGVDSVAAFVSQGGFATPDQAMAALSAAVGTINPAAGAFLVAAWAADNALNDVLGSLFGKASAAAADYYYPAICPQGNCLFAGHIDVAHYPPPLDIHDPCWLHGPSPDLDLWSSQPVKVASPPSGCNPFIGWANPDVSQYNWELAHRSEVVRGGFIAYYYALLNQAWELWRNGKIPDVNPRSILDAAVSLWNSIHASSSTQRITHKERAGFDFEGDVKAGRGPLYIEELLGASHDPARGFSGPGAIHQDVIVNTGALLLPPKKIVPIHFGAAPTPARASTSPKTGAGTAVVASAALAAAAWTLFRVATHRAIVPAAARAQLPAAVRRLFG